MPKWENIMEPGHDDSIIGADVGVHACVNSKSIKEKKYTNMPIFTTQNL